MIELQVGTLRNTLWAEWAHDTVYKGTLGKFPDVVSYARSVSNYITMLDRGLRARPPRCPARLARMRLCFDTAGQIERLRGLFGRRIPHPKGFRAFF